MAFDLKTYLQENAALVDAQLRWFLDRDNPPAVLRDAVAYSLLAPGKRLRPILVLMAAQAAGGSIEAVAAGVTEAAGDTAGEGAEACGLAGALAGAVTFAMAWLVLP